MSDNFGYNLPGEPQDIVPEGATEPVSTVQAMVPPKEELITMTREQLEELKRSIIEETARRMEDAPYMERIKLALERQEATREVDVQGQFADPALRVITGGSLAPLDHQEALARPYKTDPSMVYRFINKTDDNLHRLRRAQGYEPIRDANGNEVRYMDGVLAQMPREQYDETIGAQTKARKILKKQASKKHSEEFIEMGRREGLKMLGDGVKVDITRGE